MNRFNAMSVLLTAVDSGSLSAASRKLGTPLATISRQVSELERLLNTQLLVRSNRQLTLTDAGLSYVAACRRILEDLGDAERAASGEYRAPKGDLVITAPVVFGRLHVLPLVVDFLKNHGEINVRMILADHIVHLLDDHVDVAVRIGDLADSSLMAIKVGMIRRVICGSPDYFNGHGRPKAPLDLEDHQCIRFEGLSPTPGWTFGTGKATTTVQVRPRLVVNTAEAAINAAAAGLGVTRVLCYQVADALRDRTLEIVLKDAEPPPLPVSLVHAAQGRVALKVRAFLDFASPRLKATLAG
jgi:DNA-binding transcriptional LysR family regulator